MIITEDELVRDKVLNGDEESKKQSSSSAIFWAAIMLTSGTCTTLFAKGKRRRGRPRLHHTLAPRRHAPPLRPRSLPAVQPHRSIPVSAIDPPPPPPLPPAANPATSPLSPIRHQLEGSGQLQCC